MILQGAIRKRRAANAALLVGMLASLLIAQSERRALPRADTRPGRFEATHQPSREARQRFAVRLPRLESFYGGFAGRVNESDFDFGRRFSSVDEAWLEVAGAPLFPSHLHTVIEFFSTLDGLSGQSFVSEQIGDFDVDVPLAIPASLLDGSATVLLGIEVKECCDRSAMVERALLWIDATVKPENLRSFATFQNCAGRPADQLHQGCGGYDFDRDGEIDLSDYAEFNIDFGGP